MSGSNFAIALVFAIASGLYWWLIGQLLPFVVPMMLDDSGMLLRSLVVTLGALTLYVVLAMFFFGWLGRQGRK